MKILLILSIALAALSPTAMGQSIVENVTFFGKNCSKRDLASPLPVPLANLRFIFQNFTIGTDNFATCKVKLDIATPKGNALYFEQVSIKASNPSDTPAAVDLFAHLSSGGDLLRSIPYPQVVTVEPQQQGTTTLKRLGAGRQTSYCYGDTMPYLVEFLLSRCREEGCSNSGSIKIAEISAFSHKTIDCSRDGGQP